MTRQDDQPHGRRAWSRPLYARLSLAGPRARSVRLASLMQAGSNVASTAVGLKKPRASPLPTSARSPLRPPLAALCSPSWWRPRRPGGRLASQRPRSRRARIQPCSTPLLPLLPSGVRARQTTLVARAHLRLSAPTRAGGENLPQLGAAA